MELAPASPRRALDTGRYPSRELEVVVSAALSHGAKAQVLAFPVDEVAADRLEAFEGVLHLRFEFEESGAVTFHRCWRGNAPEDLAWLCGDVSRGRYGSALGVGRASSAS